MRVERVKKIPSGDLGTEESSDRQTWISSCFCASKDGAHLSLNVSVWLGELWQNRGTRARRYGSGLVPRCRQQFCHCSKGALSNQVFFFFFFFFSL